MDLAQAAQNMLVFALPAVIYAVVVRWRWRVGSPEIAARLGLAVGRRRAYLEAAAVTLPFLPLVIFISHWTSSFSGSMLAPFVGARPSFALFGSALNYGLLATGFPEELLFRGLIAGALFRRMGFWRANLIQAAIFVLPHLLILLVAPRLWPIAIVLPMVLGLLAGWLRHSSGSIFPGVILHAAPNIVGALSVMAWHK